MFLNEMIVSAWSRLSISLIKSDLAMLADSTSSSVAKLSLVFLLHWQVSRYPAPTAHSLLPAHTAPYLPRCTNSTEISAGETPLMRLAWPMVPGRTAESLSRASFDNDGSW
jgi:hypothetical protein